jgi:hypothetical protein
MHLLELGQPLVEVEQHEQLKNEIVGKYLLLVLLGEIQYRLGI